MTHYTQQPKHNTNQGKPKQKVILDRSVSVSDLSCAVAAQSLQVLAMCQVVGQSAVLQGDSGIDEGCGATVVIYEERLQRKKVSSSVCLKSLKVYVYKPIRYLPLRVRFDLPAPRQLQLSISETVQEGHQVAVVLVAFEVASITADLQDHVFETRAVGEHTIRPLYIERAS